MAILETTEVGNCDPGILVGLVWIGWRLACFGGKGELGHTVGEHLSGVGCVVGVLLLLLMRG